MKRLIFICFTAISIITVVYALTFTLDPVISSTISPVYTKYVNQETERTGKVRWDPDNLYPEITIVANAHGLGFGQAKLQNIYFASETSIAVYSGENKQIGIMDVWTGSGEERSTPLTDTISATYSKLIPQEAGTYNWRSDGLVSLTQYQWMPGGGISHGMTGVAVSKTGSYQKVGLPIQRSAEQASGSLKVVEKAECVHCLTQAEDLRSLSPDHDKIICGREGCNVEYRKCDVDQSQLHRRVTCSAYMMEVVSTDPDSGDVMAVDIPIEGCGEDYWLCGNVEPHRVMECGMCNTYHRACSPHYDDSSSGSQSGSGSGSGNGGGQQGNGGGGIGQNNGGDTCATCASITGTCSDCTDAQEANAGNGGDTPPSNGGCTTTAAACTNCQLSPPCPTFTCMREIIVDRSGPRHSWIIRPCGATFTKCQDSVSLSLRGDCTGDRVTTYRTYHSDEYR